MGSKRIGFVAVVAVVALVAAACGDDSASGVTVTDAWARTSTSVQNAGAAYFVASAGAEGDTLLSASVPASVAAEAQLHEVVEVPMTSTTMDMTSTTMDDMGGSTTTMAMTGMAMQEVDSVAIPANGSVEFKPGSYHVMLMNLAAPLVTGQTFQLTLHFEKAGDITVTVEVREQ
jgi:copper(I)-binding protein